MTTYNVEIVVQGKDNASGPLRSAGGALSNIGTIAAGILAAGIFQKLADGLANFAMNGIKNASNLGESINKTKVIFGDTADKMLEWSKTSATALGLSQQKALDAAAGFAVFGKAAGLSGQQIIDFSTNGLARASDMASIFNTTVEDAALAMQAAFRGETEPIRKYGVMLDDATMRMKALELGIVSNTKDALTPQQKVLAANALIMEQTSFTAGDFANTSDQLANSQRILDAQLENAGAQLGTVFLPAITGVMGFVNTQAIPIIQDLIKNFSELAGPALSGATDAFTSLNLGSLGSNLASLMSKFGMFGNMLKNGVTPANAFFRTLNAFTGINLESVFEKMRPGMVSFGEFWKTQGPVIQRIAGVMLAKFSEVAQWFSAQVLPFLILQFNKLGAWFQANGPLIARFGGVVAAVFGGMLVAAQTLWVALAPIINGIINIFLGLATFIMQVFTGDFAGAFVTLQGMVQTAFTAVAQSFTDLATWVTGWFGTSWADVGKQWGAFFAGLLAAIVKWAVSVKVTWDNNWKQLQQIVTTITTMIVAAIKLWLTNLILSVTTFASNLLLEWTAAFNALVDGIITAGDNILGALSGLMTNILDSINGLLGDFFGVGAAIVAAIQSGLETAWVNFVAWITEKLTKLISDLIGGLLPKAPGVTQPTGSDEGAPFSTGFGGGGLVPALARVGSGGVGNVRKNTYNFGGTVVYQVVAPQTGRQLLKGFD
jgi:hypothetical protein